MVRSLVLCVLALCALPSCLACADHGRVVQVSSVKTRLQDGLTVAATPSSLQQRVEQVTVSWSGLDSPQSTDWIGLYSPGSGVDFAVTGPVKLQFLTNQTADGSISFTVLNTHFDVIFALFRGGLDAPVLAGASNTVQFAQPNQPMGIHLARRVLPSEMLATWTSLDSSSPAVLWGPASGQYPFNASASSQTYAQSDMCGGAAATVGWHSPGRVHTAVMTGLAPAQAYYYVVGDAALNLWSAEQVFVTAPQPGADQPVEIIALGDVGTAETDGSQVGGHDAGYNAASLSVTAAMVNELQNNPFSLVMHVGDVTYSDGWLAEWPAFTNQVEPIAASVPWMVVPGNHERDYPNSGTGVLNTTDSGGECGIPYNTFFTMPTAVTGPTLADQPWYSFDHGPIHFLCISTEHDFNESTLQYAFIEQDFQAVDRSATPFLIFVGHRPMYVDSKDKDKPFSDQAFALVLQAVLEPLFIKYRVDMAWWGHHHTFQRTCGVANGACVNSNTPGAYNGTVHIVMGNGGTTLSKLDKDTPAIFEYVNEKHWGYNRVSVTREQLLFAQIDASNGEVKDAVTLYAQSFGEEALRSNRL